jgi:hypothetical protein
MNERPRPQIIIAFFAILVVTMACALPPASKATATTTGGLFGGSGKPIGGAGGSGSGGGGGGGGGAGSGSGGGGFGGSNGGSTDSSPTELPDINTWPYVVQQIETLGGESISGVVCNTSRSFSVLSATPHVTFSINFAPLNLQQGNVSYAYSIPSAGESHNASGTYKISALDKSGTLQLSMTVSDHVVFKGFDGNIPNRYKFNLVPTENVSCP